MNNHQKRIAALIAADKSLPVSQRIANWRFRGTRRRAAGKPLTGAYYWIPIPNKDGGFLWDLMEFYDKDYPDGAGHAEAWPEVVNYLATKWQKSPGVMQRKLTNSLYGLPRGRVSRNAQGQYLIAHGEDNPVPNWETIVKRAFNLKNTEVRPYKDDHERMLPGHPDSIQTSLGFDLGIKHQVVDLNDPEHDWDDES